MKNASTERAENSRTVTTTTTTPLKKLSLSSNCVLQFLQRPSG